MDCVPLLALQPVNFYLVFLTASLVISSSLARSSAACKIWTLLYTTVSPLLLYRFQPTSRTLALLLACPPMVKLVVSSVSSSNLPIYIFLSNVPATSNPVYQSPLWELRFLRLCMLLILLPLSAADSISSPILAPTSSISCYGFLFSVRHGYLPS